MRWFVKEKKMRWFDESSPMWVQKAPAMVTKVFHRSKGGVPTVWRIKL
jgi:hypothetical protein